MEDARSTLSPPRRPQAFLLRVKAVLEIANAALRELELHALITSFQVDGLPKEIPLPSHREAR